MPFELGGYRVVRILGGGRHTVTALVHADGESLVARVFSSVCSTAVIDAEVAVHDAVRTAATALSEHVAVLKDLVTLPDGRLALLFQHVTGPQLADVLSSRATDFTLGEAVTVLAPLAEAIEAAHVRGVTGLSLDPDAVRLSASGAPMILRVRDAVAGPVLPERFRAVELQYLADLAALEQLGAAVVTSLIETDRLALRAALRSSALGRPLAHALFDLAEPRPVRWDVPQPSSPLTPAAPEHGGQEAAKTFLAVGVSGAERDINEPGIDEPGTRSRRGGTDPGSESQAVTRPAAELIIDTLTSLGLPQALVAAIRSALYGVARVAANGMTLVGRVRQLRPRRNNVEGTRVRPRFMAAGAAGLAALLIAVVLAAGFESEVENPLTIEPVSVEPKPDPSNSDPSNSDPSNPGPSSAPEYIEHPEPEQWAGIIDALVGRWLTCSAADPITCGAEVVHSGSTAELLLTSPDYRHALLQNWHDAGGESIVVERMGGAVLVDLLQAEARTASLLVVRSEAGWRLRDVIG